MRVAKKTALYFFVISLAGVIVFRFVPVPITPLMLIRSVQKIAVGESPIFSKTWVSIEDMSPAMPLAVVASEDQQFFEHYGFDFVSIKKAFSTNKKSKRVKGASTISQQTAKNVFLWPARSWVRKGFEVYFTVLIEVFWSKERILEVYLNVIEMGDGVYGAEAAANTFFKSSAKRLSSSQAALIAATLPNPRKYHATKPSGFLRARQAWILRQMNNIERLPIGE
jgi:monofunctional biosynthetic peptidoglycan transglycosylase